MDEEKKFPKIPKCFWADWRYCWQRCRSSPNYERIEKQIYEIDLDLCSACIAARINWGENATRKPLTKEEMHKEIESRKKP
jgi:hypothetical protein